MRQIKRTGRIVFIFFALLFIIAVWYKFTFSMAPITPYEVNNPQLDQKVLIATQGSTFKDSITAMLVDRLKHDSIYIKVIHVDSLAGVDPSRYEALVIMHTWEYWKPPATVDAFISRTLAYKDKIVVLSTSGKGSYKIDDIDALSGESILQDAPYYSEEIIQRIKNILAHKI